jgi:DoxX-like family
MALLAPRLPRPREWAYAGAVFNYTGAAASHLAAGKADPGTLVFLLALTGLTAASWALRPSARRDLASPAGCRGVWMVRGGRP